MKKHPLLARARELAMIPCCGKIDKCVYNDSTLEKISYLILSGLEEVQGLSDKERKTYIR